MLVHLLNHKWYRTSPLPSPSFTPSSPPTISKIFSNLVRSLYLVWMILIYPFKTLMISGTPPLKNSLAAGPDGLTIHLRPCIKSKFWYKCYSCWSWVYRRCSGLASPSLHHDLWSCSKWQTPSPSPHKPKPTIFLFPSPPLVPTLMGTPFFPLWSLPLTGTGDFLRSFLSIFLSSQLRKSWKKKITNGCSFTPSLKFLYSSFFHLIL